MVIIPERARTFLEQNAPDLLKIETRRELLIEMNYLILERGFTENFEDYNAFGEEAQSIYDEIYDINS